MKVNAQSIPVLRAAIAGALSSVAVMAVCTDMGPKQVAGAIRNLRSNGLIKGEVDAFRVLAAGQKFLTQHDAEQANGSTQAAPAKTTATETVAATQADERAHNKRSKIGKALTLFDRHGGDQPGRRQFILGKFKTQLDMTDGAASTYFQLCRKERGLEGRATA